MDKHYWIQRLQLQVHPEGGFYREVYRGDDKITPENQPAGTPRSSYTSIYYLLDSDTKSFCHRLKSDELWYFHSGSAVTLYLIDEIGNLEVKVCGPNENEELSVLIPKNTWFGARVLQHNGFVLVSCMVSPGFEFVDFEMIDRNELIEKFPQHKETILKYTLK